MSVFLDAEDLDLVAALQVDPRAPLSRVAEVLGWSSSTVSRRLARLESARLLRVIGQLDWSITGHGNPWHVWVETAPEQINEVANALSEIPQTQFVATTAGRADVFCTMQAAEPNGVHQLLNRISAIRGVRSTHTELVLRGVKKADSWRLPRLSAEQVAALSANDGPPCDEPVELDDDMWATLRLLRRNGRISTAQVARELGVGQSTAYRMVQSLLRRKLVRPRVEIEPSLLGYALEAIVALTVTPASVKPVAEALAEHPSARYVTIVAGTSSVVHHGIFRDEDALSELLTEDLADLPGVATFDVSVVREVRKRYWLGRTGGRLDD
ncbi:Lrp/AsnC family transcriptional regulator [Saccharomonospora glauca]|jgi:DNA-binding Lrp family transcriptional regulator|uniref:Transcriptional regulator n=1 Tax=Saccharomonospora glauca K62 TaxID=928724 RepID=I1D0L9_9PSEU|nr:Lrp/AsnC family transcriptional regulator [Saccharomonospora glauca]EIE98493.1 transcriptional regulator [Saccharomonospora glauca K62]